MTGHGMTVDEAVEHGLDFTLRAWRGAWAVQLLFAVGAALLFVGLRGGDARAEDLIAVGGAVALVAAPSLGAALLRLRLGGALLKGLGPAGLQFGLPELRLVVLALAGAAASLLAWLPVVAAAALAIVLFRDAGVVHLPVLGLQRVSILVAGLACLAALGGYLYAAARLALVPVATVEEDRFVLREIWAAAAPRSGRILAAMGLSFAPSLLAVAAGAGLADPWLAGAAVGLVLACLQAPMNVGVMVALYSGAERLHVRLEPSAAASPMPSGPRPS